MTVGEHSRTGNDDGSAHELAAESADAIFNIQVHCWPAGNLVKAEHFAQRTLDLDPNQMSP